MTHVPLLSQGAKECGDNYPIVNHTVRVKELLSSRIDIDQPAILYSVSLTAKEFPGLATDMKYTVYIIACTSITCHQSDGVEICKCVITFFSAPILFLFTFYSLFCLSSTSSLCLFIVLPIPLHSFSHMHLSPPILFSLASTNYRYHISAILCPSLFSTTFVSCPLYLLTPLQTRQTSSQPQSPLPTQACTSVVL